VQVASGVFGGGGGGGGTRQPDGGAGGGVRSSHPEPPRPTPNSTLALCTAGGENRRQLLQRFASNFQFFMPTKIKKKLFAVTLDAADGRIFRGFILQARDATGSMNLLHIKFSNRLCWTVRYHSIFISYLH